MKNRLVYGETRGTVDQYRRLLPSNLRGRNGLGEILGGNLKRTWLCNGC